MKTMTLSKLKASVLGAFIVCAFVAPAFVQHQAAARARQESLRLREQLEALGSRIERFSNSVVQAQSAQALARDQLTELMKLRAEVGELRRAQQELEGLRANLANNKAEPPALPSSPNGTNIPVVLKSDWKFAGYATPEAALESFMWAARDGDLKFLLASFTPEAQKKVAPQYEGKSDSEVEAMLNKEVSKIDGLRFKRKESPSTNEVTFTVYAEEQDNGAIIARDEAVLTFRNVGGEWKLDEPL
jgi:hypothetical protein